MLLSLPLPLHELKEDNLLDRDVANDKQKLAELERVARVLARTALRSCRLRRRRRLRRVRIDVLLVFVHSIGVLVELRSLRLRVREGFLVEDASGQVLDEVAAEHIRTFTERVHGVDRLFGHREPLLGAAGAFNSLLQLAEERVVHIDSE